jgi:hypothetical protein
MIATNGLVNKNSYRIWTTNELIHIYLKNVNLIH